MRSCRKPAAGTTPRALPSPCAPAEKNTAANELFSLPELPEAKRRRYISELGLPEYDASQLTNSKALVDLFECNLAAGCPAKELANWIMGEVMHMLSDSGMEPEDMGFDYRYLGSLIGMVQKGEITRNTAKKVFKAVFEEGCDPVKYVEEHNLKTVTDTGAV